MKLGASHGVKAFGPVACLAVGFGFLVARLEASGESGPDSSTKLSRDFYAVLTPLQASVCRGWQLGNKL